MFERRKRAFKDEVWEKYRPLMEVILAAMRHYKRPLGVEEILEAVSPHISATRSDVVVALHAMQEDNFIISDPLKWSRSKVIGRYGPQPVFVPTEKAPKEQKPRQTMAVPKKRKRR